MNFRSSETHASRRRDISCISSYSLPLGDVAKAQVCVVKMCWVDYECQQAVLDKPGDEQLYRCMLEVGFLTHAAYDCPKQCSGKMVLDAIKSCMAAAGLRATQARKDP